MSSSLLLERYSQNQKLEAHVTIPPHLLRYNLHYVIQDRLTRFVSNRCTENDGFVLNLRQIANIRGGVLDKRTGSVHYAVDYIAQTLRPQIGDIVEAVVSRVFKIGIFADLGPLNIFIPLARLPQGYQFQTLPEPHFIIEAQEIKPGTEIHVRIEKVAMLDDDFLPANATKCVLKAMGELVGAQVSYASVAASKRNLSISTTAAS